MGRDRRLYKQSRFLSCNLLELTTQTVCLQIPFIRYTLPKTKLFPVGQMSVKAASRLDEVKRNHNLDMHHGNNLRVVDSNFDRARATLLSCKALLEDIFKTDAIIAQIIFKCPALKLNFKSANINRRILNRFLKFFMAQHRALFSINLGAAIHVISLVCRSALLCC